MTGTTITQAPSAWLAGERSAKEIVWKKNRLVKKRIRFTSTKAAPVLTAPIASAMPASMGRRPLAA
ncbi:hypothetical protein D3C85_1657990 [compost metagenome]